jgi:tetratricopeptide (TPR) repeat protein
MTFRPSALLAVAAISLAAVQPPDKPARPDHPLDAIRADIVGLKAAKPSDDTHKKALGVLVPVLTPAEQLEQRHQFEAASKLYGDLLASKPDLAADPAVLEVVRAEILRLDSLARALADAEAWSLIGVGDVQMSRAQYADADKTYTGVVAKKATISPQVFEAASLRANQARQFAVREPTLNGLLRGFPLALGDLLLWLARWLLYAAVLIGVPLVLAAFVTRVVLSPADQMFVVLEDKTALMPGAAADAALSEQMLRAMSLPRPARSGLRVEMVAEKGGTSLGQARLGIDLPRLTTALSTSTPFTFGPFGINVFQIVDVVRPFFRRRCRHELVGTLSPQGTSVVCAAELTSSTRGTRTRTRFEAAGASGANMEAIGAVAVQITVALEKQDPLITDDWRSLRSLCDGIQLMRAATGDTTARTATWTSARTAFQSAVLADRSNWLARMNLGDVLRKLGLNQPAAEQFGETLRTDRLPKDCVAAVKYNQAAALQKMEDEDSSKEALRILQEVQTMPDVELTLHRLVSSALIAARADRLARRYRALDRSPGTSEEARRLRSDVQAALADGKNTLQQLEQDIADAAGEEENVVLAVALNGLGQLTALAGAAHEARQLYRRSMTLLPSFVEPMVNLGTLYVSKNKTFGPTWPFRAERLLLDIRTVDPENRRAVILLGSLYTMPVFARFAEAETLLRAALPDADAAMRLGRVLFEQGKYADAVAPLVSVISQEPARGSAKVLLTRVLLHLPDDDRRKCELLTRARSWMRALAGPTGQSAKAATDLIAPVEAALAKCEPQPADTAAAGAA